MNEKLKCPYCGSTNVTRMDGSNTIKELGNIIMVDIAYEIVHCNDCNNEFKDDPFKRIDIVE